MSDVELVLDAQAILGEGPLWDADAQVLWWVNILPGELRRFDPATGNDTIFDIGQMVGTVVTRQAGGLLLALEDGIAAYDPDDGLLEIWCDPEADMPHQRFNDGKCDPAGRFWAGTMGKTERAPTGALYCLHGDRSCQKKLTDVTVSNGIVWSSDAATMYYIDSPTRRVDAFDFDVENGEITNRRAVVEVPEGLGNPDGMAIDCEDKLWVAMWGGSAVLRFDPLSGSIIDRIDVPSTNVTACAFAGANLDELYITTARNRVSEEDLERRPYSGGLFRARPNVAGVRAAAFAG